ncbi:MAG: SEC-C domain-containing protein [Actinobacteria bacterium]|nr:SEC-C domain-containing protein [Actinomycetota bacterium]
MGKPRRNDQCTCGSGRKVKHCCGVRSGPSEAALAKAFLSAQARAAAVDLISLGEADLARLYGELFDLPEHDLSLMTPLPEVFTSDLARLCRAAARMDPDATDAALPGVLARADTPVARAALARAVIALRDSGQLDDKLAAGALVDLDSRSSALMRASLIQSVLVEVGAARTPSGLVVGGV